MMLSGLGIKNNSQVDVASLSEEQLNAVNFAVAQLQGEEEGNGPCGKKLLRVENFSQQVSLPFLGYILLFFLLEI